LGVVRKTAKGAKKREGLRPLTASPGLLTSSVQWTRKERQPAPSPSRDFAFFAVQLHGSGCSEIFLAFGGLAFAISRRRAAVTLQGTEVSDLGDTNATPWCGVGGGGAARVRGAGDLRAQRF
jgi:hypothetical protein